MTQKCLFDSHAHINHYEDASERAALMDAIEASPVAYVVDVGFDMPSSRRAVQDAQSRPWCFAAVGVHPHDAEGFSDADIAALRGYALDPSVRVVAIGETGLDYYRDLSPRDAQRDAFRKQIRLALELSLPLVIHDRDSGGECIGILCEEGAFSAERVAAFAGMRDGYRPCHPTQGGAANAPDARVLLHCFSGSAEQALEYVALGCTISLAGPVTYKNNKKSPRVAQETPLSRLLVETDSPYLSPEPFRGQENTPMNVEHVARRIAELRGMPFEALASATYENAKRFFGIGKRLKL